MEENMDMNNELIAEYKGKSSEIRESIDVIRREIANGIITGITIQTIGKLDKDRTMFFKVCKELEQSNNISVELEEEIKATRGSYVEEILRLKKQLVYFYNKRVHDLGVRFDKAKGIKNEDTGILNEISSLEVPVTYDREVTNCQDVITLNIEALNDFEERLKELESRLGILKSLNRELDELKYIESIQLLRINNLINSFGDSKRITKKNIELDLRLCLDRINVIRRRVGQDKEISNRIELIEKNIMLLREKLRNKKANKQEKDTKNIQVEENKEVSDDKKEYYELKNVLYQLYSDVEDYYVGFGDNINVNEIRQVEIDINNFLGRLKKYHILISKKYDENSVLYENLMKYVIFINKSINKCKDKVNNRKKNLRVYNSFNIYDILNKDVQLIGEKIRKLDDKLEGFGKVIEHESRSKINSIISSINLDIDRVEKHLGLNIRIDKDKEEKIKNKIEELKQMIKVCEKKYRSKCPLLVKHVKQAGSLFKKYDKKVLIVSALSGAALANTVVGPFVIPVIIFGNVLLVHKFPILNKYNKILADSIGARKNDDGVWVLNNGVEINPITALLKSIAVNKIGAPKIVKDLIAKIKELSIKEKLNNHINNIHNNVVVKYNDLSNKFENSTFELRANLLYYKYLRVMDTKSVEEFCQEQGLDGDSALKFKLYVDFRSQEIKGRSRVHG